VLEALGAARVLHHPVDRHELGYDQSSHASSNRLPEGVRRCLQPIAYLGELLCGQIDPLLLRVGALLLLLGAGANRGQLVGHLGHALRELGELGGDAFDVLLGSQIPEDMPERE